jgi:hypothetical protein
MDISWARECIEAACLKQKCIFAKDNYPFTEACKIHILESQNIHFMKAGKQIMLKHFISFPLFILLTSACVQQYTTPAPATEIQFAQPMATTTPTALFNSGQAAPTSTPPIMTATAVVSCSAPAPHVETGQQVTVMVEDFDKLKLRSDPQISPDNVTLELELYTQLRILDGPVCVLDADTETEYLFWKVAVIPSGEIGWVAEGDATHYFFQ